MSLTKGAEKRLRSLTRKKQRALQNRFFVEGRKMITELLTGTQQHLVQELFVTESFSQELSPLSLPVADQVHIITERELQRISLLKTPQDGLAVVEKPALRPLNTQCPLVLYLDGIQDPGNMGTLLRLADWFGLEQLTGSASCAEVFNPKVVQASMGAILRVPFHELDLIELHKQLPDHRIVGADLDGTPIYNYKNKQPTILVVGSEGQGISAENMDLLDDTITIPKAINSGAESLNAAIATGILISWLAQP